jgi:hypothetical protein
MDKLAERYFELKQMREAIEREMAALRSGLLAWCAERRQTEAEAGGYKVKIVAQTRRVYDDDKLLAALPDPALWRLAASADAAKIAGLLRLKVLTEDMIRGTYTEKHVQLLHVEKL